MSERNPFDGIPDNVVLITREAEAQLNGMSDTIRQAIGAAYLAGRKHGFDIGRATMREAILKAAETPVDPGLSENMDMECPEEVKVRPATNGNRARRGSVRNAITQALTAHPGATEKEIAILMEQVDPEVSGRSAGGELRRMKGKHYRQVGSQWFLLGDASVHGGFFGQKETAEPQGPAVPQPTTTEEPDAPAPIAA